MGEGVATVRGHVGACTCHGAAGGQESRGAGQEAGWRSVGGLGNESTGPSVGRGQAVGPSWPEDSGEAAGGGEQVPKERCTEAEVVTYGARTGAEDRVVE